MAYQGNKSQGDYKKFGGNSGQQGSSFTKMVNPLEKHKTALLGIGKMSNPEDLDTLLDDIKKFAESMGKDLSSSQLRNVFSKVKTAKTPMDIQLMRPKLMYVAARQKPFSEAKRIMEFLETIAAEVKTPDEVKHFQIFMEAFVAYHKYYYPKDGQ